jgi:hypothetical protein
VFCSKCPWHRTAGRASQLGEVQCGTVVHLHDGNKTVKAADLVTPISCCAGQLAHYNTIHS